ncbi:TKL protein kinase [Thecamonas trahens ATCC 50062]|uniref:TKL protein kinase n=1 Tax=Thecamonas trahens ATCC 50062 TaxID=461836 RepID=A0A0L0D8V7_THETB|nr:TKL protein kinase [Thecamonas trahens ATCC 50062]KNC48774.1 TKL protein kinase [Thecamonas trahens ATCC 50062]|eukprot:XP_013762825.1 TKL protein kinase [Thecamonas trahens ATCC 50062]
MDNEEVAACLAVASSVESAGNVEVEHSSLCLLSFNWFLAWHKHVVSGGPTPPPINNTPLLAPLLVATSSKHHLLPSSALSSPSRPTSSPSSSSSLISPSSLPASSSSSSPRANAISDLNGVFVPEAVWERLVERYGGGPKYLRKHLFADDVLPLEASGHLVAFHVCVVDSPASARLVTLVVDAATTLSHFCLLAEDLFVAQGEVPLAAWVFDYHSHHAAELCLAGDGLLLAAAQDDQILIVAASGDVTTDLVLELMSSKLAMVDATIAAIDDLRAAPNALDAIDALAGLWTRSQDSQALQCSRKPIIFGLLLAAANKVWRPSLEDALDEPTVLRALGHLLGLLTLNDFAVEFDAAVMPPHLRRFDDHLGSSNPIIRDLTLLFIELVVLRCPSLASFPAVLPRAVRDVLITYFSGRLRALRALRAGDVGGQQADVRSSRRKELFVTQGHGFDPATLAHVAGSPALAALLAAPTAPTAERILSALLAQLESGAPPVLRPHALPHQGQDHPSFPELAGVESRRGKLLARLAEVNARLTRHSDAASRLEAQIAADSAPRRQLARKLKAASAKREAAAAEAAEMRAELESVEWQREVIALIALVDTLVSASSAVVDSVGEASLEVLGEYTQWAGELEGLVRDVVSATTYVGMVGLMKAGKSSTISGLVGLDVCPSRSTAMTVIPTLITHVEGKKLPTLVIPESTCLVLNTTVVTLAAHFSATYEDETTSFFGNRVVDDIVHMVVNGQLHFTPTPVVGLDAIHTTLVALNDVIRLCEYVHIDGANPLLHITELRDLPQVELEFAVMAETGMFGRLSFIDSPGPNEEGMDILSDVVKRILKQASIVAVVLNYAALNSEEQVAINATIAEATADVDQEAYVFVNKFDQRNTASGDMDEAQVRDFIMANLADVRSGISLRPENIFPVSAKFAQYANTARHHILTQAQPESASPPPLSGSTCSSSASAAANGASSDRASRSGDGQGGSGGDGDGDGSDSDSIDISDLDSSSDSESVGGPPSGGGSHGSDAADGEQAGASDNVSWLEREFNLDNHISVPDPDVYPWVEDFARIAWGETWADDEVYPRMLANNDVRTFMQGIDAVWRNSHLNEPLDSMLRHCYTNAGVISLRTSLMRASAIASKLERDVTMHLAAVASSVVSLEKFLEVSASAHEDILSAIRDIKDHAATRALEHLPAIIQQVLDDARTRVKEMTSPGGLRELLDTYGPELTNAKAGLTSPSPPNSPPVSPSASVAAAESAFPSMASLEAVLLANEPVPFEGQAQADGIIAKLTALFEKAAASLQTFLIGHIVEAVQGVNENMGRMVQDRLQPHLAQYQRDLDEILGTSIEFPHIEAPDLNVFGSLIKSDTLRLVEQQTTTKWALFWLFKFIPIPRVERSKTCTYAVDPALIKSAFSEGLAQVFESTLQASSSLSSQMVSTAVNNYTGKVERELNKLIARIRLSIENKRSRHDQSVLMQVECEELLWRTQEFRRRAGSVLAAMASRLDDESAPPGGRSLSSLPRTSVLFPRSFEYSDVVIDAPLLPLTSLLAVSGADDGSPASTRFSSATCASESSVVIRNGVFSASPMHLQFYLKPELVDMSGPDLARSAWGPIVSGEYRGVPVASRKIALCTERALRLLLVKLEAVWALSHAAIVPLMGVTLVKGGIALVSRKIEGASLGKLLDRADLQPAPAIADLPLTTKLAMARRLVQALDHAHQHNVRCEFLDAHSVLVPSSDPASVQLLIDGGVSVTRFSDAYQAATPPLAAIERKAKQLPLRSEREVLRALYLAPELLDKWVNDGLEEEELRYTNESDVYAMGMILYQLFSGLGFHSAYASAQRLVWGPAWAVDLGKIGHPEVASMIATCLAPSPADRPTAVDLDTVVRTMVIR